MTHYVINPGDTVQLGIVPPPPPSPRVTPGDIYTFLTARGWAEHGPSDFDEWKHEGKRRLCMTWEQAVAIEFYEFITLGGR